MNTTPTRSMLDPLNKQARIDQLEHELAESKEAMLSLENAYNFSESECARISKMRYDLKVELDAAKASIRLGCENSGCSAERDKLRAENERLREALKLCNKTSMQRGCESCGSIGYIVTEALKEGAP